MENRQAYRNVNSFITIWESYVLLVLDLISVAVSEISTNVLRLCRGDILTGVNSRSFHPRNKPL